MKKRRAEPVLAVVHGLGDRAGTWQGFVAALARALAVKELLAT